MSEQMDQIAVLVEALSKFAGYAAFVSAYAEYSGIELKDSTCITSIQGGGGSDYLWWENFNLALQVHNNLSQASADWRAKVKAEGAAEALERFSDGCDYEYASAEAQGFYKEFAWLNLCSKRAMAEAATLRGSSQPLPEPVKVPEGIVLPLRVELEYGNDDFPFQVVSANGSVLLTSYSEQQADWICAALNAAGGRGVRNE